MRRILVTAIITAVIALVGALPAAAQQGVTYTVRGGDTLAGIAARYGVTTQAIAAANNITNPNTLFAGQVLFIPTAAPVVVAQPNPQFGTGGPVIVAPNNPLIVTPPPVVAPSPPPTFRPTYTVRTGDTLYEIAQRYGTTTEAIAQLNGITNVNNVRVGQVLVLPSGATPQFGTGGPVITRPFQYVVQPGDYVGELAVRYGTTVAAITQANNLSNPSRIFPGQVLVIP